MNGLRATDKTWTGLEDYIHWIFFQEPAENGLFFVRLKELKTLLVSKLVSLRFIISELSMASRKSLNYMYDGGLKKWSFALFSFERAETWEQLYTKQGVLEAVFDNILTASPSTVQSNCKNWGKKELSVLVADWSVERH